MQYVKQTGWGFRLLDSYTWHHLIKIRVNFVFNVVEKHADTIFSLQKFSSLKVSIRKVMDPCYPIVARRLWHQHLVGKAV